MDMNRKYPFQMRCKAPDSVHTVTMASSPGISVKYPASDRSSGRPCHITCSQSFHEASAYSE